MSAHFYASLFANARQAGVYHLPQGDIVPLQAGAVVAGCLVLHVDLATARDKHQLLATLGKGLRFPEWFGYNWDALNDCLLDMSWLPAEGYVVILEHCDGIHARAESDFVTVLQLIQDAAVQWREESLPFWCLVDMQSDGIAWLPTMAQDA